MQKSVFNTTAVIVRQKCSLIYDRLTIFC